jgi:HSP20 family protein
MHKQVFPQLDPYDIFVKNLFDSESVFSLIGEKNGGKLNYPVDIIQTKDSLILHIACVGLSSEDIKIAKTPGQLHIKHQKSNLEEPKDWVYISRSISRKSLDLVYKISAKYDLDKVEAQIDKGLLQITIPVREDEKPQEIVIK